VPRTGARVRQPVPASQTLAGLGERLRDARQEAGLSQTQLGSPHFTRAYVSAIELGKVRPAVQSLEFMAGKLGKPVSFFLQGEKEARVRMAAEAEKARALQLIAEGRTREAISLLEPLHEHAAGFERAELSRALGRAFVEGGDGPRAVPLLNWALAYYQRANDREQEIRTRAQLGAAVLASLSYSEAAVHFQEVLAAYASGSIKDPLLKVHVLHNLGVSFQQRGDYKTALQHYERAEREGADIADPKWLASLYAAMGMARHSTGDFEAAIVYLRKSEALFESINNRSRAAEIKLQMGIALWRNARLPRALEMLRDAEAAARHAGNEHVALRAAICSASVRSENGQAEEGAAALASLIPQVDASGRTHLRFTARFALGHALKASDPSRAEIYLREAIAILEGVSDGGDLADAYSDLSEVLARNGLAEEAVTYANKAFQVLRSNRVR
jgi:HTH-type transcriptional regulator, quorum sensing regulator NprR